jgi:formylglycine-generating enzyme required for sulfatase activity
MAGAAGVVSSRHAAALAGIAVDSGRLVPSATASPNPSVDTPALSSHLEAHTEGVAKDMLLVPGGEFTMGADTGGEEDEHPAHRVRVDAFYLDRLEVTVADYLRCVQGGKCRMYREDAAKSFHAGDDARFRAPKQPISGVSWDDAVAYCAFVGKRLPREAEWERAASGDDRRRFVWGNDSPDPTRHGCFMRAVGPRGQTTCDVGSYPEGVGPYGHLDLAGNVWEWTSDDYDPYAYRRPTAGQGIPGNCEQILLAQNEIRDSGRHGFTGSNPVPTTCEKVLRGGAFNYPGPGLRVTNRVHHPRNWRMLVAGFRCAKDAPGTHDSGALLDAGRAP